MTLPYFRALGGFLGFVLIPLIGSPAHALEDARVEVVALPEAGDTTDFSLNWRFALGEQAGGEDPGLDDGRWRSLDVPHDYSIEQDFDRSMPVPMGMLPAGVGWYRKTFTLPEECRGRRVSVLFDGVYMDSTVYLNGTKLGRYPYGYTPFSYDLTGLVKIGGEENVMAVRVDSPLGFGRSSSRWYAGAGINREVALRFDAPVHLENNGIRITNEINGTGGRDGFILKNGERGDPLDDAQLAEVRRWPDTTGVSTRVRAEAVNASDQPKAVRLRVTVLDYASGEPVAKPSETRDPLVVAPGTTGEIDFSFELPEVRLWDLDDPRLYLFQVDLLDAEAGATLGSRRVRYGFRRTTFTNKDGFYLNGRYLKIKGVCLHADQGALGMVSHLEAVRRQVRIMKEMGANAIRPSHNPPPETLLQACDEQGMMVMNEWFDTWFAAKNPDDYHLHFDRPVLAGPQEQHPLVEDGMKWSDYDIKLACRRDRNCPSVIMWCLGNEIYDTDQYRALAATRRMLETVRKCDDTRPVTLGFPMWGGGRQLDRRGTTTSKLADMLDLVGMNYPGNRYAYYQDLPHTAGWILFGSETASAWKSRGYFANRAGRLEDFGLGRQISSLDNATHFNSQTAEWINDRNSKPCLGQFIWSGFDYIGEPQPYDGDASPPKSSYYGSVDTCGFPKAEFYMLQGQWLDPERHPMVKIVNHLNLDNPRLRDLMSDDGGESIQLWVATNLKSVGLWVVGADGAETPVGTIRDWDQGPSPNPALRKQEPTGNPPAYADKLYQVFTVRYEEVAGKKVIARAFDKPAAEVGRPDEAVATDRVAYSSGAARLSLTPERRWLRADGHDLCYITVDVTDSRGNIDPNAMNAIEFSLKGEGRIVGVDNGDPVTLARYKARAGETWSRHAFNGKALVIVQSTPRGGSFELEATSPGLFGARTTVFTVAPGDPVRQAADAVVMDLPCDTTRGQLAERLPAEVALHGSDGGETVAEVKWDTSGIGDDQLGHDNVIRLRGTIDGQAEVEAIVSLTGERIETLEGMSTFTGVGEAPELPSQVALVSSLGSKRSLPIAWDGKFLTAAPYDGSVETVVAEGSVTVDGEERRVRCPVRVISRRDPSIPAEAVNVALAANGGTAGCSYQEGATRAEYTNDGRIDLRCWGNFQGFGMIRSGDFLQYDFDLATVDTVRFVALNYDAHRAFAVPQEVKVRYLTAEGYRDVPGAAFPEAWLGWDGSADPGFNEVRFDPVRTRSIRVFFSFPEEPDHNVPEPTGKSQIKVGISEVTVEGRKLPYAPFAGIGATVGKVLLDGVALEDFKPAQTDYAVVLPAGTSRAPRVEAVADGNGALTVLPTSNPYGTATIQVTSEDGSNTRKYVLRFTVAE